MKIAKLILHYNTPEMTLALCAMVPEAIVVDNGSEVNMTTLLPIDRVIRYGTNLGFTKNWNRVLMELINYYNDSYDAFWLMNSDIEISRDSIDRIQQLMDTGMYPILTPSFNSWMRQINNQGFRDVREVHCIELTAPVIMKEVFMTVGYFDPQFNLGSGVDFDFALRAKLCMYRMYCDDASSFRHAMHGTISKTENRNDYANRANNEMNQGMSFKWGPNWRADIKEKLSINKSLPMKKKVAVYTTIFGDYDYLKPITPQSVDADYYCIADSDNPAMAIPDQMSRYDHWKIIKAQTPRHDFNPRMKAKFFKIIPHELEQLRNYETLIYIDGSVLVTSEHFVKFCLDSLKNDIALFAHPQRGCIYDEAVVSKTMSKYQDEPIDRQVDYYSTFFPKHTGLYACGVIVRKMTDRVKALMGSWFHENIKYSYQDQISFPVVCMLHKITPDILPGNLYQNQYFKLPPHKDAADQAPAWVKSQPPASRIEVMQHIIDKLNYVTYLEIGLRNGDTFNNILCKAKESVDPVVTGGNAPTFLGTSDMFFKKNINLYNMIFIDGDHHHEQVARDLDNAIGSLRHNGCVVLHDTNPIDERTTEFDRCGDAFRVLVDVMISKKHLELYTISIPADEGNGISIVFKGPKTTHNPIKNYVTGEPHPYDNFHQFDLHRQEIANMISWEDFKMIINTKTAKI